jgi:hypothetical protein
MIINRSNYEEYFLLYTDRELNREEQLMVEDFVRLHPDLEKEFNLLKQTIALPPVVVFEGKEKLLKEEKKKRVLPLYWLRIAASLLIVLTGAWFWLMSAGKIAIRQNPHNSLNPEVATGSSGSQKENTVPGTIKEPRDTVTKKTVASMEPSSKKVMVAGKSIAGTNKAPGTGKIVKTEKIVKAENVADPEGAAGREDMANTEETINPANLPGKKTYHAAKEKTPEENLASITNPPNGLNRSLPVEPNPAITTNPPSTINHQPSTTPDRTLAQNTQPPDDSRSILIFNNNDKAVPGFFKKLLSGSPDKEIAADSRKRKIKISVFQFNISK